MPTFNVNFNRLVATLLRHLIRTIRSALRLTILIFLSGLFVYGISVPAPDLPPKKFVNQLQHRHKQLSILQDPIVQTSCLNESKVGGWNTSKSRRKLRISDLAQNKEKEKTRSFWEQAGLELDKQREKDERERREKREQKWTQKRCGRRA